MGGTLEANSILGAGSAFTLAVTLPAAAAVAPEMEDHDAEFDRPLRILLADDHPVNRTVVQLMFEGADVEFACAENGAIALELFKTSAFDLVLMDMQMPVMDGLEATRSIRALERSTGRPATPVIMLSANALPEHFAAGKAAGADIYLAKPIVARDLFAAVEASLAQAAVRAAA